MSLNTTIRKLCRIFLHPKKTPLSIDSSLQKTALILFEEYFGVENQAQQRELLAQAFETWAFRASGIPAGDIDQPGRYLLGEQAVIWLLEKWRERTSQILDQPWKPKRKNWKHTFSGMGREGQAESLCTIVGGYSTRDGIELFAYLMVEWVKTLNGDPSLVYWMVGERLR